MNSLGFNKKEKDTKVIVAMSGGVDSSVAAVKLKKEGYDVTGVTLRLYNQPNSSKSKSCCAGIDIEDASKVAKQYDFPHRVFDYQDKFFNGVINNFVESYSNNIKPEIESIHKKLNVKEYVKMKSSLKFCVIAAGEYDGYVAEPRAYEWDIAAGHAILISAGGTVTDFDGNEILYGKKDLKNPSLILKSKNIL